MTALQRPFQHLRRLVALLLGVDHVRLGEHRAAPGDRGRLARAADDVADVLDVVEQAVGLLVHERAGAGRAVAVGLVVGDAHPAGIPVDLELDELGGLAAHLEDGGDVGMQRAHRPGDGLELVLSGCAQAGGEEASSGARHPDAGDGVRGHGGQHIAQQLACGFDGVAFDSPVTGHEEGSPVTEHPGYVAGRWVVEQVGVPGGRGEHLPLV